MTQRALRSFDLLLGSCKLHQLQALYSSSLHSSSSSNSEQNSEAVMLISEFILDSILYAPWWEWFYGMGIPRDGGVEVGDERRLSFRRGDAFQNTLQSVP